MKHGILKRTFAGVLAVLCLGNGLLMDTKGVALTNYVSAASVGELYEGRFIGIGDTVVFNDYEWGVWDCNNPEDVAPNIDTFTVTDVEYDDHFEAYYFNTDSRFVEFIAVRSEEALDPAPTGFYVTGGNGTEESPFIFELAYDSVTYTYHAAVPATCTTDGTIEYWEGSDGKYYADENGNTEIDSIIIPATGHSYDESLFILTWINKYNHCNIIVNLKCKECNEIIPVYMYQKWMTPFIFSYMIFNPFSHCYNVPFYNNYLFF